MTTSEQIHAYAVAMQAQSEQQNHLDPLARATAMDQARADRVTYQQACHLADAATGWCDIHGVQYSDIADAVRQYRVAGETRIG